MKSTMRWLRGALFLLLLGGNAEAQKVVEVEVQGELRKVAESLILSTISLVPGIELSQENVQAAVRDLQGLNVFSDIQIWGDPAPGGVKLFVMVVEMPALEGVRFKGNENLKEKEMKEGLGLVVGQVVSDADVIRGEQTILELYREKGYLRAQISGRLFDAEEKGKVFLQYEIDEGEKVKIKQINLKLRHEDGTVSDRPEPPYDARRPGSARQLETAGLSQRAIKPLMETKEKRWWRKGEFKGEVLEEDKEKILGYYRSQGYQQAMVSRDSVYYDSTRKNLFIDLEIDEGMQYRLGAVDWGGNSLFSDWELAVRLELEKGAVYGYSGQELSDLVRMAYYEKGYLDTRVMADEQVRGDTVDVSFQVFEGQPWTIRRIHIAGNTKTREKVIRREVELRPGDVYKQNLVQESQRRIYMLNFFRDVQLQPEYSPVEGERYVDLTFQVEERPTGQASMGAGYSDRDKLVGQIGLQIPNFRGLGQNLDFSWEFGTRREQFLVGFTEPWLFDTPTSLAVRVYTLNQNYYDYYDYRRDAISVRVGRRLRKPAYSSLSMGYRLENSNYSDFSSEYASLSDESRYQPRTTSTFDMTYQRDTRDLAQFATRGTLFSYKPEIASSLVAGDVDFHRHEVGFNYYHPSWWKFVLSLETKVAVVDGFSKFDNDNIPFWERFTPGGVDWWDGQVRGYPDQSLGPRQSGIPIGGNSMMVLNLEYRFPLAEQQVYGLLFADAGNAWAKIGDISPLDLRRSVGFGFRVMTPMLGMIGFDFGYGFDRRKVDGAQAGWSTHFQFGPQFF
ncbi:MAG: outer membrane protein assembly factor BamA [Gemmatimonadetes bacterium]|nr:outer membrane protein assembly factor BamA [Gemmatimonadota bacterium]